MLAAHVRMVPVEVRLLGREEVQIPGPRLPVALGHARPGAAGEVRDPVRGRQLARLSSTRAEPEAVALRRSGTRGKGRLEPRVLIRHMVRDDVDNRADAELERLGDERLRVGQRAERRVDRPVVGDVVAAVHQRRRIPGVEPERVDAERLQVAEPGPDAGEVSDPVPVPVGEAAHVHLVDDRGPPPVVTRITSRSAGHHLIEEGGVHGGALSFALRAAGSDRAAERTEYDKMTQELNISQATC
ncbi:hypothetical protein GCM10025866_21970 [Naasia aerilata]|uniref:Uncharacterized protein n=1 Tax=Naasia aerilata TaxID=1162966 RepID=A0ABN6XMV4_9MICO|nr:hypothetical protein GCM10025866_21970 [Naasia aerilata]